MEKIGFYSLKRQLHFEMLKAIERLFEKAGVDEIDLCQNDYWPYVGYVMYSPKHSEEVKELAVKKVRLKDKSIEVLLEDDKDGNWINCRYGYEIITCSIDSLYEAVYDFVAELDHEYYVCLLGEDGKPTGEVDKVIWKMEYAEDMMKMRGFIYNDLETAMLHAKHG